MTGFKPALILAAITAIVSALIIITYDLTYKDTSGVLTDKQAAAVTAIYGGTADDYTVVPAEKWRPVLETAEDSEFSRVVKVIKKNDGCIAFEVVVKGYKEGYDLMVGIKDGTVYGVSVVSVGEETPQLGTKTADPSFLDRFKGISDKAVIVKREPSAEGEVQAVASATRSSNGVAKAVNIALGAYDRLKDIVVISADLIPEEDTALATGGGTQ